MPTPQPPSADPTPAPDPSPGIKPDDTPAPKTYTQEELDRFVEKKLTGQGKELKKLRAEAEALAKWKEEREQESLSENEKLQKELAQAKERAARADELEAKEAARLERLTENNAERVKALPKGAKERAEKWGEKLGAEDFADFLGDIERQIETRDVGHGGKVKRPSDDGEKLTSKDPALADWTDEEGK